MNKFSAIFSILLCINLCTFQAFSSSILEDEPSQTLNTVPVLSNNDTTATAAHGVARRSTAPLNNIRSYLGGALVLASQVSSTMAADASDISFDDSICSWNSTSRHISCACPTAVGISPGEFFINNIGVIAVSTFGAIILVPNVNKWFITPGSEYIWNRFCKTTIDDVPLGDEPESVNLLKRIGKKIYKKIMEPNAFYSVFQVKLRDYQSVKLKAKIYQEIKLIDSLLSNKVGWAKDPIMENKKYLGFTTQKLKGFSYENAVLKLEIIRISTRQYNTDPNLPAPLENNLREQGWKEFADALHNKNSERKVSALPGKVYEALKRLVMNKEENESVVIKNGDQFNIIYINGICIKLTKFLHDLN